MQIIDLAQIAMSLPQAWHSAIVGAAGSANIKVLRMDAAEYPAEVHDYAEVLLVVEGCMNLDLSDQTVGVKAGQLIIVPPGTPHAVAPGSKGTLVIIDPVHR